MTQATDFVVAIPARFGATRLPGKPLRLIAGEPIPRKIDTHCLPTHPGLSLPKCRRRTVRTASGAWSE